MEMTDARWQYTSAYLRDVFGAEDRPMAELRAAMAAAELPRIEVSADVGRFLRLLVGLTPGRLAIELGTLGGYSAAWIARGLRPGGRLVTVEAADAYADFAEAWLARLALADRVEVRRGAALEVLERLGAELEPGSVDFAFLDADKREYPDYLDRLRPLLAPGALLVADNVLGTSAWWIDHEDHPERQAVDAFNRAVVADPSFEPAAVPLREGVLVARKHG